VDSDADFNAPKVASVVALIALLWPAITPALLAKVLFFADRYHLCGYGRPVTGVRYFATTSGPMPASELLPGELRFDLLSETDVTAVNKAVSFCRERPLTELNALARQEPAWIAAPTGGEIDLALLVRNALA
jgi:hypothetical protein